MRFEDVSERPDIARRFDKVRIVVDRQDHNGRRIGALRQLRGRFQAGEHWHRDIENDQIRLESGHSVERGLTIANRPNHLKFGSKQIDEPFEHDWVIFGQEYPNTSRHCPTPTPLLA